MFRIAPDPQIRMIYGWQDDRRKGRTITLINTLLMGFYNVFITGIFYTGFLSMYGIDLVGVGIVTLINPLANSFILFSPWVLERIQKRKNILLISKIYYYFMVIVATNIMPLFVTSPSGRIFWFCFLQFMASAVYALFNQGFTSWFYNFFPKHRILRTNFISYNQISGAIMTGAVTILSGVLASAVQNSPMQKTIILGLRYFAFILVLVDVYFQAQAKEYPYPVHAGKMRIRDVFTLPMKYKKFMGTMLIMFAWNYIANLNNGLWHYYLLNNVGFSYGTITLAAGLNGACVLLTTSLWRRVLYRLSWLRTFAFSVLLLVPLEIAFFFVTKHTTWLYLPLAILFHIASVGVNLSYANVLYLNLPRENSTTHISFQAVFSNICAFLGLMSGTLWCKLFGEDTVIYIGSLPTTAVQYTTLFRAAALLILGVVVYKNWEKLTPESELELLKLKNNNFSSKEEVIEDEDD